MALKNDFIIIKKVIEFDYGLLKESDLVGPSREFFWDVFKSQASPSSILK
jgi:hypothetical protein